MQGVWIQSLVGELRSHIAHSQKTKIKNSNNIVTNSIKHVKNGPHQKKILKKYFFKNPKMLAATLLCVHASECTHTHPCKGGTL